MPKSWYCKDYSNRGPANHGIPVFSEGTRDKVKIDCMSLSKLFRRVWTSCINLYTFEDKIDDFKGLILFFHETTKAKIRITKALFVQRSW